jgi:hypothetical protein
MTQALLRDRHRPRERHHAHALGIADHRLEDVGRLAERPSSEGGARHAPDQVVDGADRRQVQGGEGLQTVLVPVRETGTEVGVIRRMADPASIVAHRARS